MLRSVVDMDVGKQGTTHAILGQHAFEYAQEQGVFAGLDVLVVRLFHQDLGCSLTLTAGIAGVVEIDAVCHLLAGQDNLVGVDDDYIVAALYVGRVAGLVFAAQNLGNLGAEATKYLIGGVNHYPLALDALGVGHRCFVA